MFSQIRAEIHNLDAILLCYFRGPKSFQGGVDHHFYSQLKVNIAGRDVNLEPACLSASRFCLLTKFYEFSEAWNIFLPEIWDFLCAVCTKNTKGCCHFPQGTAPVKSYPILSSLSCLFIFC